MSLVTGIIGCGNMGGGMASRLIKNGTAVFCYDANKQVLRGLENLGCTTCDSVQNVAKKADILILSLPTAEIVEQIMTTIHTSIETGTVVLDTSTSKPKTSQSLSAQAIERGYHFLDAPVSGGPAASNSGTMTMLIGGNPDALEIARPVLEQLTARIVRVGPSGSGHAAKIANNMLCAANLVLVGEAIRIAKAAGVDATDLLEGVNAGSGRSGVSEINYPSWILNSQYDSGFTMGLMRKDVKLAVELAQQGGVEIKAFKAIAGLWDESAEVLADSEDFNRIFELGDLFDE